MGNMIVFESDACYLAWTRIWYTKFRILGFEIHFHNSTVVFQGSKSFRFPRIDRFECMAPVGDVVDELEKSVLQ